MLRLFVVVPAMVEFTVFDFGVPPVLPLPVPLSSMVAWTCSHHVNRNKLCTFRVLGAPTTGISVLERTLFV